MSTYGTMLDRIDDELDRGGSIDTQIARAVQSAITHYASDRFWFNEGVLTDVTVASTEYYDYPDTLLTLDSLRVRQSVAAGYFRVDPVPNSEIEMRSQGTVTTGLPRLYSEAKAQVRMFPVPDAAYATQWFGLIDLGALSADADTNAWMVEGEALIRQRAKAIVRMDVLREAAIAQETALLLARGSDCLSIAEEAELKALRRKTAKRVSTGYIRRGF